MTSELTPKQMQIAELKEFAQTLKNNGFNVLVSKDHPFEWLYFEKDGKIGDVNRDHFVNFNFGTVHKPCRECGTGFQTARETTLTIKNAENTLINYPNWATPKQRKAVVKYKDINDFLTSSHTKWANYYIL